MNNNTAQRQYSIFTWALGVTVLLIPFIAWASVRSWNLSRVTALSLFPLLGLWAWSIMWTHYSLGSIRIIEPKLNKNETYSKVSRIFVLLCIVMHPGLLIWSQWNLRGILPPESMYGYVDSSLKIFVFFGTVSLLLFLSFELLERLKRRSWVSRYWKWVSISQMIAMTLIFIHAIAVGSSLNTVWFELYWVTLGALLIPCFAIIGRNDWQ